jgi:hypothetical protein
MKEIVILHLLFISTFSGFSQSLSEPEEQISFAKEDRPLKYYVAQADLWWNELQKDLKNEKSWYNYYRANRNAQGTANWSADFVKEGPNLMLGEDIVVVMGEHIPDSFTYNFVRGSTAAVYPGEGKYLLKAYQMNPDFPGLLATVATYATSTHNLALRQEANKEWFKKREFPISLINHAYNTLQSVAENGVLLTQHDNDTYPVWMLQDAKNMRTDILVINIDFLLFDGYRDTIFKQLNVPSFLLEKVDVNEYETNWENVVQHFLIHYKGDRPIHIGLTVSEKWYKPFIDDLEIGGLTRTFKTQPEFNIKLFERELILDYLKADLEFTTLLPRIREMNTGYLLFFDEIYDQLNPEDKQFVQEVAHKIISNNEIFKKKEYYESRFH